MFESISKSYRMMAVSLVFAMSTICLAGCSHEESAEIAAELQNTLLVEEEGNEAVVAEEPKTQKKDLDFSFTLPKCKRTVVVETSVENHSGPAIEYGVNVFSKTDENMKKIVTSLFGESYEILLPRLACTDQMKDEYAERFEKDMMEIMETSKTVDNVYRSVARNGNSFLVGEYKSPYETPSPEYQVQEREDDQFYYYVSKDRKDCRVLGELNGEKWLLIDSEMTSGDMDDMIYQNCITLLPYDRTNITTYTVDADGAKDIDLNKNEDVNTAKVFLESMGLNDYVPVYASNIFFVDTVKPEEAEQGLIVGFAPAVGEYFHMYSDNAVTSVAASGIVTGQNVIRVGIYQGAVFYSEIVGMSTPGDVISSDKQLIEIDEANKYFEQNVIDYIDSRYISMNIKITDIEFAYITVNSADKGVEMVPAWIYYAKTNSLNELKTAFVAINAVNGEAILFPEWSFGRV